MKALITTQEVINNSIVERTFNRDKINMFLVNIEQAYMLNVFGRTYYDTLLGIAEDWNNVQQWKNTTTYSTGDKVLQGDYVYKSTANANTEMPSNIATNWVRAKKFTNDNDLNELWDDYLAIILANKIIKSTIVPSTVRMDKKGATISESGAATQEDIAMLGDSINELTDTVTNNMRIYIENKYRLFLDNANGGYDYSEVGFIKGKQVAEFNNAQERTFLFRNERY